MLRKTTLTFLGCLLLGVQAQSQKIDSLKNALLHQSGEERFSILYDIVFEYLGKEDFPEALKYIEEAQQVAGRYDDSLHIVKAGRVKGMILQKLDRTADAINELQKVIFISQRHKFEADHEAILNGLAVAYTFQAKYDKALQYHFDCLTMREKRGNHEDICITLNNIGMVYYKLKNSEKALEYYKRTLEESNQINVKQGFDYKDRLLINIGLCNNALEDFESAVKFIQEGMKLCAPECSDQTIMQGEFGLGVSLLSLDKPKEAEGHFLNSYHFAKNQNDKRFQLENLIYLAKIKMTASLYEPARKLLEKAEIVGAETHYNELLINVYMQFSKLYIETKDYKNGAAYQGKYISLKDSIHSHELTKNLMKIHAEFEERENKARIAAQEQILRLKEEAIHRQRWLNLLTGALAVLFIALALILARVNKDKQKTNHLLEQKVKERTQSLEATLAALQRSHSELEEFIVKTSRDIQSPMVTMRGLSNIMLADSDDPQTTRENVKQLERIITSLAELQYRLTELNDENHSKKRL